MIDPSAGSGTFLVEAMKLITKELKYKQRDRLKSSRHVKDRFDELFMPDRKENKWAREYLYGSEINFDLGTASKVNMILHGDGSTNIFVKDGLLPFRFYVKETKPNYMETASSDVLYSDKEVNGKFDIAVSNPPFSVDLDTQTQREVKNAFLFGDKKNSENLFIERYYQLLKEGGHLGVYCPKVSSILPKINISAYSFSNISTSKPLSAFHKLLLRPLPPQKQVCYLLKRKQKLRLQNGTSYGKSTAKNGAYSIPE